MKNKLISFLIGMLLLCPLTYAVEWRNECLNTTTLNRTVDIVINGNTTSLNQVIDCTNGCSTSLDDCRPDAMNLNLLLVLVIAIVFVMIGVSAYTPIFISSSLIMISMVITGFFAAMDLFPSQIQVLLAALLWLELIIGFFILKGSGLFDKKE